MTKALKIIDHGDRGHAPLGGSSAKRWLNCSASIAACKDLPEEPAGPAALEGTIAHEYMEARLRAMIKFLRTGEETIVPDPEDTFLKKIADYYLETIMNDVLDGTVTDKVILFEAELIIVPDIAYGYVDFCVIAFDDKGRRFAWVVDYKHGYGVVDVEKNEQLAFYSVGLQRMLTAKNKPLEYIKVGIYQPRTPGETWKTDTLTAKQLAVWDKKFQKGIDTVLSGKVKYKTGDHCFFCRAKTLCPSYSKNLSAQSRLTPLDLTVAPSKKEFVFPDVETVPLEHAVKLYLMSKEINSFLKKISERLHNHVGLKGEIPPGLKIVQSKPRRKWINDKDPDAIAHFANVLGLDPTRPPELIPMTQIEKLLKKDQKEELLPYIEYGVPKQVLVSLDDEREAVPITHGILALSDLDED